MRSSRHGRSNKRLIMKTGFSIGIVLAVSFLIFLNNGKLFSTAAERVKDVSQNAVQQQNKRPLQPTKHKKLDGKPKGKVVYLTFDDGPSSLTGQFLDVLQEHNVKATFFMQGSNLKNTGYQDNVKRAVEEGHYVGAHSMTHDAIKLYDNKQFVPEMLETLHLIRNITGTNPKLTRPPYGSAPGLKGEQIRDQIADAGIKIWDWTIDSYDWKLKDNPSKIVENVKKQTTEDLEVVLMHEKQQTLQVLPEIIEFYKEKGYEFAVYHDEEHFRLNFQKDDRL
ncbi:polysaccharide deacetylase [Paenibacillus sp. MER 180]|uniref:polysaccharide deacetylase family protein n=1 Tax=Paenibacillus sp. MER 180 TaxID=2939570 RepID=UPI00203BF77D|nr:polysaccharide deacetylase family protein [Paenibacillus sp. MER 180]MCM3291067.1 polysaccharide deacetylase [Paenibacillus sp. MER 180]